MPMKNVNGNSLKNQWKRADLGARSAGSEEMMLDTDMCLAYTQNDANKCHKLYDYGRWNKHCKEKLVDKGN